jgi:signal transduction histidine kinase
MVPLRLNGEPALKAWLALSRETADSMLQKERQRGFVFIGFMVCIAILSIGFLYRSQARHLANMREMERRLHRAERLSAMGRLAAGVAHEIRNPLNAMGMACQRLQKDNLDQLSKVIRDEIRRLNQIVEEFIGFSRCGHPVLKQEDITALLRQMALLVEEEASSRGISLRRDWPESPLMIWMDADKIRQALFNIIKNAMESIPDQGTITLALSREGRRWVAVRISDTGTGLSPEEVEHIFDPDYTTKEKGLGLGLALAHEIIEGHGGEIRVKSAPGRGTLFEVVLPVEAQGVRRQRAGSREQGAGSGVKGAEVGCRKKVRRWEVKKVRG